jgi:hypothetical protein
VRQSPQAVRCIFFLISRHHRNLRNMGAPGETMTSCLDDPTTGHVSKASLMPLRDPESEIAKRLLAGTSIPVCCPARCMTLHAM